MVRRPLALIVGALLALTSTAACSGDDGGTERTAEGVCGVLFASPQMAQLAEDFDPTDVPRALETLGAMELHLDEIRDAMPDEGRDELDRQLVYVRALHEALSDVDPDDPTAVAAAVNGLADEASEANLAATDLQRFQDTRCATSTTAAVGGPSSAVRTAPEDER
ncbi:MAG: hypothetical protein M3Z03_16670 [Actinomycetota bacterium]|nr:hypothetical protein [Actinomycetota bacterium]